MSKVFEHIVNDRLKRFLAPKLHQHQFGFRGGHQTLDLLSLMSQSWTNALRARKEVRVVALDISKAFDRVWHDGLMYKLECMGVSGPLLAWLRSFLSGRTQRVVINGVGSDFLPMNAGVPQGSVLAPLLFLVFINDLFVVVRNCLDIFADDSTLWAIVPSVSSRKATADSMSADLASIESWAKRWLVTFNAGKTESLIISSHQDMTSFRSNPLDEDGKLCFGPAPCPHPHLVFCARTLPESLSFKVVGLTFTCKLSWKLHISNIAKSAASALRHLRRARNVISRSTLATIYKSHVRSRMEYCSAIWLGAPASSLALLDNVQSKAAKLIGHTQAIELQSLAHRRGVAALCAMHRIVHKTAPEPLWSLCPPRAPPARANTRSHARFFVLPRLNATTPTYWIRSFISLMTVQWNNLPPHVQAEANPRAFKSTVNLSLDHSFL